MGLPVHIVLYAPDEQTASAAARNAFPAGAERGEAPRSS
jgi:hypothetical protein